ncbi:MAG: cyclic nucleotide-binding domain-containing protein [Alphaproteobacteria bacterium]
MKEVPYPAGTVIYREGDASNAAFVIVDGEVAVERAAGESTIPLAVLRAGQIFGEVGIIRNRARSTTTRARTDTTLIVITREDFDAAFGDKDPMALNILRMLCERLSDVTQRVYEGEIHAAGAAVSAISEIKLLPGTPAVESQIGRDGIVIDCLPFRVGRRAIAGEPASKTPAELLLLTTKPFEMAPMHFVIEDVQGRLNLRDLGSVLGTLVNGTRVAPFEASDSAPLKLGMNQILVGGLDSSIAFNLVIEGR